MNVNIEKKNNYLKKWYYPFLVFIFFTSFFFVLLSYAGTLKSGYHHIDDHEMVVIHTQLQNNPFLDTAIKIIKNDFNIRFRPFYYFHRVLEIKIFGLNFFALSLYTALLGGLTSTFFYFGARKLRFSKLESLVFVLLTLLGPQFAIWWRLGPAETIGTLFLALSFFFMTMSFEDKRKAFNNLMFVIFLLLASLSKESFIVIIPAFIFYKIWNEISYNKISIKTAIQKNLVVLLPLPIMAIELYLIYFVIGTNEIGYAGATSGATALVNGAKTILTSESMLLLPILILGFALFIYAVPFLYKKEIFFFNSLKNSFAPASFFILIVIPGLVICAKSGMMERYLLPTTIGVALLTLSILKNIPKGILERIAFSGIILFLLFSLKNTITNAKAFAAEGKDSQILFSIIIENSNPSSRILLVADPAVRYEVSDSIRTYLSYYGHNNFYVYPVILRQYTTDFEKGLEKEWHRWFENKKLENIGQNPGIIIVFDKESAIQFFKETKLRSEKYKNLLPEGSSHAVFKLEP